MQYITNITSENIMRSPKKNKCAVRRSQTKSILERNCWSDNELWHIFVQPEIKEDF